MILTTRTIVILKLCILYNLLPVHIKEVQASYGDSCTPVDTSNCTQPQLLCSGNRICTCSRGYLKDNTHGNNITCRKPGFNEACDTTTGCQGALQCTNISGSIICRCYGFSEYYDPRTGRCESKPTTGQRCDVSIGCVDYNKCVDTSPTPPTCQCNSSDVYLDNINSMCLPLSDLQVNILSTTVSTTWVNFKWDGSSPESGVEYNIQWVPIGNGTIDFRYAEGGQVSGLLPGTQYNFTIVSSLSGDLYHPEKIYFGPNLTVCTKNLYGGQCDTCKQCQDNSTVCTNAMDNVFRCLCQDTFFNASLAGNCTSLDQLIVANISSTSTTSVIDLNWLVTTKISSVTYQVDWYPNAGHMGNITSTGVEISGLGPGIMYYISISSMVLEDAYNFEKRVTAPEYITTTKSSHLQMCASYAPEVCQQPMICTQAKDGTNRCLCGTIYYYSFIMEQCSNLGDLRVFAIDVMVTATTATLTWTSPIQPTSITYTLTWIPSGGRLDYVNGTTAHVSGLTSGTLYNFTIVSVLPSDAYYPEIREGTQVTTTMTKPAFNEKCNLTIGCQDYQHCINISGSMVCQCDSSSEYYDTLSDRCVSKPSMGEPCDESIACVEYYQCEGQPPTCQCNSSSLYLDVYNYQCMPMSDLQVSMASASASATTVTFNWYTDDPDSGAMYDIQWTPPGGKLNFTDFDGGLVTDLQPGTLYNFTIVSVMNGDEYYPVKKYFGPNITVCTYVLYGGECSTCNVCQDNTTTCMGARDGKHRCLCGITLYNRTQTGNCLSLAELSVNDVTSKGTTSTINFSWAEKVHISSVTYRFNWIPSGGQVDSVSSTGGTVSGLTPGTLYYFSITSVVAADAFNDEKNVTSPEYILKTQLLYLSICVPYTNEECQDMTSCVQANDHMYYCMCGDTSYFVESQQNCSSLDDLKVSNVSVTVTATTSVVTWTLQKTLPSLTYTIGWNPMDGNLDNINSTYAHISGLSSGTTYNFSIDSVLLPGAYYPEKTISVYFTVKTKSQSGSSGNHQEVGVGVGVGVGCAIFVIIIVVVIVIYRRRTKASNSTRLLRETYEPGSAASGDVDKSHHKGHSSRSGDRTGTEEVSL